MSLIVAGTGHRPDKLGGYGEVNPTRDRLKVAIRDWLLSARAANDHHLIVISGMALGFDQWLVEVCVDLQVPFIAAVPFRGQESRWPEVSQCRYRELLARAQSVEVVSPGGYAAWKMQRRNEWMVDRANYVLAAWDASAGGTANCVAYARKIGRPVANLLGMRS